MKILHVNTNDSGGAAKACLRLHDELLKKGVDSKVLLKTKKDYSIPETISFRGKETLITRMKSKIKRICRELFIYYPRIKERKRELFLQSRNQRLEKFSYPESDVDITQSELYKEADIIHLHWVADFLDFQHFFQKNNKQIVWTLHDMNPFSGGEHFCEQHVGIDKNGYPIQRIVTDEENRTFKKVLQLKQKALRGIKNIRIVAPSDWMREEADKSELFEHFQIDKIANGINGSIFQPRERAYSRKLLGISQEKKVLLFVAENTTNSRKGYEYLLKAIEKIDSENVTLCSVGEKSRYSRLQNQVVELGKIHDERLMSAIYSAADAFIIPSLMDNLPNTVLESLLCGTPVIGFPVGGLNEIIVNGENGYLTKQISVGDLVDSINAFLQNPSVFDRQKIRENAFAKYDTNIQAEKYLTLYKSIINPD